VGLGFLAGVYSDWIATILALNLDFSFGSSVSPCCTTRQFAPTESMMCRRAAMRDYRYDHVHLRSPDPDADPGA
jgi:hypothetical protein